MYIISKTLFKCPKEWNLPKLFSPFIILAILWGFLLLLIWFSCILPCFWKWLMGFPDQQKSWLVPLKSVAWYFVIEFFLPCTLHTSPWSMWIMEYAQMVISIQGLYRTPNLLQNSSCYIMICIHQKNKPLILTQIIDLKEGIRYRFA